MTSKNRSTDVITRMVKKWDFPDPGGIRKGDIL